MVYIIRCFGLRGCFAEGYPSPCLSPVPFDHSVTHARVANSMLPPERNPSINDFTLKNIGMYNNTLVYNDNICYTVYMYKINEFRQNLRKAFNDAAEGHEVVIERYEQKFQLVSLVDKPLGGQSFESTPKGKVLKQVGAMIDKSNVEAIEKSNELLNRVIKTPADAKTVAKNISEDSSVFISKSFSARKKKP